MFPSSYFGPRYFPERFFSSEGVGAGAGGGYYPTGYFPCNYFAPRYYPKDVCLPFPTAGGGYFPNRYFAYNYFAPRFWAKDEWTLFHDAPPVVPEVYVGGGAAGGHPWPEKLVNTLFPKRIAQDDEDFLLVIDNE